MDVRASIIIPAHNRAGLTMRCLEAVRAAESQTPYEVVVVDDGSTDGTTDLLRSIEGVQSVRREHVGGFAAACNAGARASSGDYLVFLNNDTMPRDGWLDALIGCADSMPRLGAAGSKLLFPDGTVQHAGVAICEDGRPRHIYAGFPGEHPAVNRPRTLQAVTAAAMLVPRARFDEVGGFEERYQNSLEDTDLCLRLGAAGYDIHYCPASVVEHLESATRGSSAREFAASEELFLERWGDAHADEFHRYVEDGLITIGHDDAYPLRLEISPELAVIGREGGEVEQMLLVRSRQVHELLREVVRLTIELADHDEGSDERVPEYAPRPDSGGVGVLEAPTHTWLLRRSREIELEILDLQAALAKAEPKKREAVVSERLRYRRLVCEIQELVEDEIPPEGRLLVVSRGDDDLVDLPRPAEHFPRARDGRYLGSHPADAETATRHLEELRGQGAQFLLIPEPAFWWLEYYREFRRHLDTHYGPRHTENATCVIYDLRT